MLTSLILLLVTAGMLLCGIIDVNSEQIVTLSQLAKRLPRRRSGRPVHPATIHRWRNPGVRGVRLECVRIGGIWHTSLEAYQRWVDQLTAIETPGEPGSSASPSALKQTKHAAGIERRLDDLSI